MDLRVSVSGRGAFYVRRSGTVRSRGAHRRENAGVSSETWVRIPRTENPRFPEEGSSALGKSGPKARTKVVVDGQLVEIPVPPIIRTAGTQKDREGAEWKAACKHKVASGRQIRQTRMKCDADRNTSREVPESTLPRKAAIA